MAKAKNKPKNRELQHPPKKPEPAKVETSGFIQHTEEDKNQRHVVALHSSRLQNCAEQHVMKGILLEVQEKILHCVPHVDENTSICIMVRTMPTKTVEKFEKDYQDEQKIKDISSEHSGSQSDGTDLVRGGLAQTRETGDEGKGSGAGNSEDAGVGKTEMLLH